MSSKCRNRRNFWVYVVHSVADPYPGSRAFLTPGIRHKHSSNNFLG